MQGRRTHPLGQQPRLEPVSSSSFRVSSRNATSPTSERRSRLPPRSRSGCWTCRTRKVKCDESKPECGECLRLGHPCDYNPRLSFRDDTPRTVERMMEVYVVGSSVFDGVSPITNPSLDNSAEDLLPPFAELTTDEERERKAELQRPGTYHVITNPGTFASLDEYREPNKGMFGPNLILRSNFDTGDEVPVEGSVGSTLEQLEDPNTVILKSFHNHVRRPSLQFSHKPSQNPVSPNLSKVANTDGICPTSISQSSSTDKASIPMIDIARQGGRDRHLLHHYQIAISPQIFGIDGQQEATEDIFEVQARTYPPLYHAIMALAALSMARRGGSQSADALEHYQKVIPALKNAVQSSQDSFSDGALFTHFILLLYEIAAAGNRDVNMWQHHSNQLLRIVTLRRQANSVEPFEWIVWMVYSIDVYALLSMSGTGAFAEVLKKDMPPPPENCLLPPLLGSALPFREHEALYLQIVVKLNQEMLLLALQVGQLARELRQEARQRVGLRNPPTHTAHRQARIQNLLLLFQQSKSVWAGQFPEYKKWLDDPQPLPPRIFDIVMHSYVLFRACIIYAHTSMYPGQLSDPLPSSESDINSCTQEIIQVAQMIMSKERFDLRYIIFPLFMAGFASKDITAKASAQKLIQRVEGHSFGYGAEGGKKLLESVYEKQRHAAGGVGNLNEVDWIREVEVSGLQLIIYGL